MAKGYFAKVKIQLELKQNFVFYNITVNWLHIKVLRIPINFTVATITVVNVISAYNMGSCTTPCNDLHWQLRSYCFYLESGMKTVKRQIQSLILNVTTIVTNASCNLHVFQWETHWAYILDFPIKLMYTLLTCAILISKCAFSLQFHFCIELGVHLNWWYDITKSNFSMLMTFFFFLHVRSHRTTSWWFCKWLFPHI